MGIFSKQKKNGDKSASSGSGGLPRVSDFLSEKTISFFHAGPSKRQVFGQLLGLLDLPDPSAALKAILAREEAGSTVIAPGLALPHARVPDISRIQAALGISPTGMEYSRTEKGPVRLIVLFLGPADNMREHLAFLASVSALFQKSTLVKSLLSQTTPQAVLTKIREAEKTL